MNMMDSKKLATVIVGNEFGRKKDDHVHAMGDDGMTGPSIDPELEMAADEIMEALKKDDKPAFISALCSFIDLYGLQDSEDYLEMD